MRYVAIILTAEGQEGRIFSTQHKIKNKFLIPLVQESLSQGESIIAISKAPDRTKPIITKKTNTYYLLIAEMFIKRVCELHDIDRRILASPLRTMEYSIARQMISKVLTERTPLDARRIGLLLGRSRYAILANLKACDAYNDTDEKYNRKYLFTDDLFTTQIIKNESINHRGKVSQGV